MKQLIIGGARSGKSTLAKNKALAWQARTGGDVTLIVTAPTPTDNDTEMAKRIVHHQMNRPDDWSVVEAGCDLAAAIDNIQDPNRLVMVDCLTLWLANELMQGEQQWQCAKQALFEVLAQTAHPIILIGNEVGQGVIPLGRFNRQFVDELGWLHQHLTQELDCVTMTIAGLPMLLKGNPEVNGEVL